MKPTMFIGSSVEGLGIAEAIQSNLSHSVDVTIWSQGIFELSNNTLDELVSRGTQFDFAAFILSPDDVLHIRKNEVKTARDNVLFELGLFIGAIGKGRVFFVTPKIYDFHLPTDLHGTTAAIYDPNSHEGNVAARVGHVCTQLKDSILKVMKPSIGLANLQGDWSGYWEVNSNNFPEKNHFDTNVKQIGTTFFSSITTKEIDYPVVGEIHRGGFITGIWGNPENGATYFGPFQLVISPCGKKMRGKWSGFKIDNSVDSGEFYWSRNEKI